MKRNNQHPALYRVRSFFSSLMLATVLALSLGSCSEKSVDEVKPTAKAASTKANINRVIIPVSHNLQVHVPHKAIKYFRVNYKGQNTCFKVFWTGWFNTHMWIPQGDYVTITYTLTTCAANDKRTDVYGTITRPAPGNDGYSDWWVGFHTN